MLDTLAVALAACTPLPAADLEATAEKIEAKLMAPCCGANPLSDHFSGPAEEMKIEIRAMLADGRSEKEILDFYVAKLGEKISIRRFTRYELGEGIEKKKTDLAAEVTEALKGS